MMKLGPTSRFAAALLLCSTGISAERYPFQQKEAGPPPQVIVLGSVRTPGAVEFKTELTLMGALSSAGGASFGRVFLVRDGKSTEFDLDQIRKGTSTDPVLKAWDIIYVR